MLEQPLVKKPIDVKRGEHLIKGISPIMACVGEGTVEDFEKGIPDKSTPNIHNIDFYGESHELQKSGFKNDVRESYVISPVDHFSKYSKKFYDCTGLVVAGKEKASGENISFMSHQNPNYFLRKKDEKFSSDLIKQIQLIKSNCESGTIDAVAVGGKYVKLKGFFEPYTTPDTYIKEYMKSIRFLQDIVKRELGFELLIITGPKTMPGADCIFYDNTHRKLYLMRESEDFDAVQSFSSSEIEERRKNWKPGEEGLPSYN